jgi:hypothetical protein
MTIQQRILKQMQGEQMATVYLNGYLPKYQQNLLRGLILFHDWTERRAY